MDIESSDGAARIDGGNTSPAPGPTAEQYARQFLEEHSTAYFGKDDPQHDQVVREYRDRLAGRVTPTPVSPRVEPHSDAFAFLARDAGAEPFVVTPELEEIAAMPTAKPPSAGPDDPLAQVPKTPDEYELTIPQPPEGSPGLDSKAVGEFRAEAHAHNLSHHQAQAAINQFVVRGLAMRQEAGDDPLSATQIGEVVAWCKGHGFDRHQTAWLVDTLDRVPIPRLGKPPQAMEAEALMRDQAAGYFSPEYPAHQQTRQRVAQLFAEASAAPGYYRR